jgi:DNA-binding NtrC family response regulator
VQHFLSEFAARHHRPATVVDPAVYAYLSNLSWPGNIRQLRHVVERAVIFCEESELTVDNFRPRDLLPPVTHTSIVMPVEQPSSDKRGLHNMLDQVETKLIREALARNKGNKKRVAEELGISRSYLYKKLGVPEPG